MTTRRIQKEVPAETPRRRGRPATTPEAREQELIALSYDAAEKQVRDGTASSQVLTHFLKLGSTRERIEQERLRGEIALQEAKIESMKQTQKIEELMEEALAAMKSYAPERPRGMEEDDDY